ncbi:hypothetical protein TEA_006739 [Camellia sinensis var. sinensis]|uniref:Transcription factor CBF/NF-Y/archaeal histone domain-containing protein n=1 Tax=Camellia sinensis var. sinensis TaxID=542762 RepID=A0A4S4E8X7_CAMSN|nr:hypothetical protein TEA_006739 [Camellia sinensis var. sinensis]
MDQPEQTQHQLPVVRVVAGSGQMAYASPPYHMMASGSSTVAVHSPTEPPATFSTSQHQLAYQQAQNNSNFKYSGPTKCKKLRERLTSKITAFHLLEERTLEKNDIAAAISRTDVFDFLVDITPRDELKEEGLGVTKASIPMVGSPADSIPFYYVAPQHPVGPTGMIMGKPVDQASLCAGQQPQPPWHSCHGLRLINNKPSNNKVNRGNVLAVIGGEIYLYFGLFWCLACSHVCAFSHDGDGDAQMLLELLRLTGLQLQLNQVMVVDQGGLDMVKFGGKHLHRCN